MVVVLDHSKHGNIHVHFGKKLCYYRNVTLAAVKQDKVRIGVLGVTKTSAYRLAHRCVIVGSGNVLYLVGAVCRFVERAAKHGNTQAQYELGKILFSEGNREEARERSEHSAQNDAWTQTSVGILLCYEYKDYKKGKELL